MKPPFDRLRSPRRRAAARLLLLATAGAALIVLVWPGPALAIGTSYTVGPSPPASANWTDTSSLWSPAGSFPGSSPGDSASDTQPTPTTLTVDSAIPNPIVGLDLACTGCVLDVQAGGNLTLAGAGSIASGAELNLTGGTFTIANGATLTFQSGAAALQVDSGTLDVQSGGTAAGAVTVESGATLTCSGTIDGLVTVEPGANFVSNGCTLNGGLIPSLDGTGSLDYIGFPVGNGSTENGLPFAFTLASGEGFQDGALQITVPSGWSAPSTNPADPGYTTSDCGTVGTSGQIITITAITLTAGSCYVFYGDLPGPGLTAPTVAGPSTFETSSKSTSGGTFEPLTTSPDVDVLAPDGSGTMTTLTDVVMPGTRQTVQFTYTAAFGGIFDGLITLMVPPGWSAPSDSDPLADGYTTVSTTSTCGCPPLLSVFGRTIFVDVLVLGLFGEPDDFTVIYGDTSGGGQGATAPSTPGKYGWRSASQASCNCEARLRRLAASPMIRVLAPDGSGTITATPTKVSAGSHTTVIFDYKAVAGGMQGGAVSVDVPAGWSPPSDSPTEPGYVTASAGTVSTLGQTITVSGLTQFASGVKIKYGARSGGGPGALVTSSTGPATWAAMQKATAGGTPTALSSSPQITVYAPDGSGTLTTPTTTVVHGSTQNTISFTYTAAAGGLSNGTVAVRVPPGWSGPSTGNLSPGYSTASAGTVSVSGQFIVVSALTLAGGSTVTITYGSTSGGAPGATAPGSTGTQTWRAAEGSTGLYRLVLGTSPTITVT